jgi:hypothetical protein
MLARIKKMTTWPLLSIWLLRTEGGRDDEIEIRRTLEVNEILHVKFTPGDSSTGSIYRFKMTRSQLKRYLGNMFYSVVRDNDPFEKVQISPITGPAIMYHVNDLQECQDAIMETIEDLLYTSVTRSTASEENE